MVYFYFLFCFQLIDDSEFETSEQFDLGLMEPAFPARLGPIAKATAILDGPNDGKHLVFFR